MKTFFRRMRGIALTSATWALGWGITGAALLGTAITVSMLRRGLGMESIGEMLPMALIAGVLFGAIHGTFAGAALATFLSVGERRRRLADLSLKRMALWGGLGGVAMPVLSMGAMALRTGRELPGDWGIFFAVSGVLGATFAAGTLALARRAEGVEDAPVAALEVLPPRSPFDTVPLHGAARAARG